MIAAHWLSARTLSIPSRGGKRVEAGGGGGFEGGRRRGVLRAGCGKEGGTSGGWRDACSRFPYRCGTVVCAFMKICQTHPRPIALPLPSSSLGSSPPRDEAFLLLPPVPPLPSVLARNDRIRDHLERTRSSLTIVIFPLDFRFDRYIIVECDPSQVAMQ